MGGFYNYCKLRDKLIGRYRYNIMQQLPHKCR